MLYKDKPSVSEYVPAPQSMQAEEPVVRAQRQTTKSSYMHMYVCKDVFVFVCVYPYSCMHVCIISMYVCMHEHTHTHTHTQTHNDNDNDDDDNSHSRSSCYKTTFGVCIIIMYGTLGAKRSPRCAK